MAEEDREDRFWMVWNPNRDSPTMRHYTLEQAKSEASRLARLNPGQRFYVLKSVRAMVQPIGEMHEIRLTKTADQDLLVPF